jgi:hypothetical protein
MARHGSISAVRTGEEVFRNVGEDGAIPRSHDANGINANDGYERGT